MAKNSPTKREIKKILVANRGEIAVRIIRAARDLNIATVAVYSEVDRDSAHVALADESIALGGSTPAESYLNQEKILAAAAATGADALHPGFGFFSENAAFARACKTAGILFIGPQPETIDLMGDKLQARTAMQKAGVPTVPGSDGAVESVAEAKKWARQIGYPILLKAAAGGGGKGMRVVEKDADLESAFENTRREAENYFGNGAVFMERFVQGPHHIEVQVMGDRHGNVLHFFERECSVQRRHQKVVEEAPSPFLVGHDDVREKLFAVAVKGAREVNYHGAGTMEFIMDKDRNFFFLEMNTRIQVEHPVTELITGMDLVAWQIRVARGEELPWQQNDVVQRGAAIECRLYAEDPENFLPTPGSVTDVWWPGGLGVRIDTAIMSGNRIPLEYDPMIAKICTWGESRDTAMARMRRALSETVMAGTITNLSFLRKVMDNPVFIAGNYTTHFISQEKENLRSSVPPAMLQELLGLLTRQERFRTEFEPGPTAPWVGGPGNGLSAATTEELLDSRFGGHA